MEIHGRSTEPANDEKWDGASRVSSRYLEPDYPTRSEADLVRAHMDFYKLLGNKQRNIPVQVSRNEAIRFLSDGFQQFFFGGFELSGLRHLEAEMAADIENADSLRHRRV